MNNKTREELLNEITELKAKNSRLEERLADCTASHVKLGKSDERLKEAEKLTKMGHWMYDFQEEMVYWSDELYNIFEVEREQFDGSFTTYLNLIHPDDRERVNQNLQEAIQHKKAYTVEHRILLSDKREKHIYGQGEIIYDEQGEAQRAFGTAQDVTQWKSDKKRIEHLNQIYKALRNVNKLIVTERNRQKLIRGICESLTNSRGYEGAWIVLFGDDNRPVDYAGAGEENYFNPLKQVYHGGTYPECVKRALESQGMVVISESEECTDELMNDNELPPGHKNLTVKLEHEGTVFGLLHTHLTEDIKLTEDEKDLFLEVAGDVSFALSDILKQKLTQQMAEELQTKEVRLEEAEQIGKLGYWEYDLVKSKTTLSDNLYRLLGYEPREFEADYEDIFDMIYPDDRQQVREIINELIEQKKPVTTEFRVTRRHGEVIWLEARYHPKMDNGKLVKVFGTNQDITERKTSENKLSEAAHLLRATVESTIDGVLVVSNTGKVLLRNQRFLDLWNIPDRLADAKDDRVLLENASQHLLEPEKYKEKVRQLYQDEPESTNLDTIHFKDGRVYEHYTQPLLMDGVFEGRVWSFRDVTNREKREKELWEAKQKAEESDRLKSAFLANVSHEIRTPMNGIMGFTEMLRDEDISADEMEEFIQNIEKGGNRMLATLNDLMDISKIETGQVGISITPVNINEKLKEYHDFFKRQVWNKGLELILGDSLPQDRAMIFTDSGKLNSILSNLIKNSIKYTPEGHITFGCRPEGDGLMFYVEDTGIGISSDKQEVIFNRFVQADMRDTKAYQGSGLGLAIAKSYVEMLGGEIKVSSVVGEGTAFYFFLPFQAADSNEGAEESEKTLTSQAESTKHLTILIVEDDGSSEMYLTKLLQNRSERLLYARDGQQALNKIREHPETDLILMDLKMPQMDGLQLTRKIREFNNEVKIIAQTAYAMQDDREKALDAGCDEYITKPIKKERLIELLEKVIAEDPGNQPQPDES